MHQGVELTALLGAFRVGSRELWSDYIAVARQHEEVRDELLFAVSPYLLDHFGRMEQVIAAAYLDEQYQQSRRRDVLRYELCHLVFGASEDQAEFNRIAEAIGLDPTLPRIALAFDTSLPVAMQARIEAELDSLLVRIARVAKIDADEIEEPQAPTAWPSAWLQACEVTCPPQGGQEGRMKEHGVKYAHGEKSGTRCAPISGFGGHLADCFGVPEPDVHAERKLERGPIALSELRLDLPMAEPSESLGYDEAFLVDVQLASIVGHEYWLDGRAIPVAPAVAGMTYIHDLRLDPRALVREPTHSLHFRIPLATLNAIADQHGIPSISELIHGPMVGRDDPVMRLLCQAALAALQEQHMASGLLLDEILSAVCAHTLGHYGHAGAAIRCRPSGLARWQERRAKDLMDAHMDVSLAELAQECQLSVAHFVRGFRRSTGLSPHQWLLARRISKAKAMLVDSSHALAHIALECGFSSQSHFSAAFKQCTQVSPGQWRRSFAPRIDNPAE